MKPTLQASIVWGSLPAPATPISPSVPAPLPRDSEHRSERRYVVSQAAELSNAAEPGPSWRVRIRDISSRGMQLVADEPIAAGPEVQVRWNGHAVSGTVRYNHKCDGAQYRIGVEFRSSSQSLMVEMLGRQAAELEQAASTLAHQQTVLRRYRMLLDLAAEAMIVTSLEGSILFWNQAAERLYGWSREEALGRNAGHLFEARVSPEIPAAGNEGELRHVRKDGSAVIVCCASVIQTGGDGRPEAILLVSREVAKG